MTYTGSCLCGAVCFAIDGELAAIQMCYCQQCRKAQGGAFAAVVPVATTSFRFIDGQEQLQVYESSPGKQRVFCGRCGSPVFSRRQAVPDVLRVRVGLLDEPLDLDIAWHAYTGSKCRWWSIRDGAPQFEEGRVS